MRPPSSLTLLVFLLGLTAPAAAQQTDLSLRAEAGWFNRAYQDRQFVSPAPVTFAVPYGALGAEARFQDARGSVIGFDLAQTTIGPGSQLNRDVTEVQPLTVDTLGGVFVGWDGGWWELDAGVAALVQLRDFGATGYRAPDGTVGPGRTGGLDWDRRESFTLVTGLLRVFPEDGPHVVVRLARGPLSLTENLFHVQGVLPGPTSRFDAEVSFSSPQGYWLSGNGVLRSNERLTLGWALAVPGGWLGLRVGFLVRPEVAGTGEVDPWHRLSLGLDWSVGPYPVVSSGS